MPEKAPEAANAMLSRIFPGDSDYLEGSMTSIPPAGEPTITRYANERLRARYEADTSAFRVSDQWPPDYDDEGNLHI